MTPTQSLILNLMLAAALAPLLSSVVVVLCTRRFMPHRLAGGFTTAVMAGSFACSLAALLIWLQGPEQGGTIDTIVWNIPWIPVPEAVGSGGWLYLGLAIDSLTVAMMSMVTGIAFLVHLYSIGYMAGDKRYNLFFAYLSLFSFSMIGIVVGNSLITLFVCWELVGLTSYLLIGFWFEKRGPQLACKKAFVMNRIGDAGFLVGIGILYLYLGGQLLLPMAPGENLFEAIRKLIESQGHSFANPPWWLTVAGLGIFCGAIGKSAQFPLHTWLPDAMEGPTPVSSIVHSATMVAAGVYLTARVYAILTPDAHLAIATIGLVTLVMAAAMALVMTDIKRVLAYSTLSQLGYMMLGLGTGAWAFALYHLIAHAYFKCCLFQCAGSVIHAAHHEQDMRRYGGLARKMPVTAACFAVCTLAIAGASIPLTDIGISGYYSKDGIIAGAVNYGQAVSVLGWWGNLFWIGPTAVAYLTAFYMARAFALTFLGRPRNRHLFDHAHEAPISMILPQVCLAVMAVISLPWLMPFLQLINEAAPATAMAQPGLAESMEHGFHAVHAGLLHGLGWMLAIGAGLAIYWPGLAVAERVARVPGLSLLHRWALNKFYFDALYDGLAVGLTKLVALIASAWDRWVIDALVNAAGWAGRGTAELAGECDRVLVDGSVSRAAEAAQRAGLALRMAQTGRVRLYVLVLMTSAAGVALIAMAAVLTAR